MQVSHFREDHKCLAAHHNLGVWYIPMLLLGGMLQQSCIRAVIIGRVMSLHSPFLNHALCCLQAAGN